ncbi:MAG: deoxyribose-phosphate aldolase [Clostridiaceae bacterium]|nr:deoxyribose-phosphate aldolase [Clostridiaceae bacterium]
MDKKTIASMIDHAVLKPDATDEELRIECELASKYGVATVCVKPCHVSAASVLLKNSGVKVSTVIGFPHGSATTSCKVYEAREAIENGAEELDMVINLGKLKSGDYDYVREDIKSVADAAHALNVLVKVILETALLSDDLITEASRLAEEAGADYVKTSTGFNGRGASLEDVELMRNTVSPKVRIKASGGIKNLEQALKFANAGCLRLGTSGTVNILSDESEEIPGNEY